ncbi:GNAT family N-acetyltransferase [Halococcus saccharolyticus]|uniref:Acetyltransferase n=1 Tax=Halococcus saccharolyticus DSM 5350 TaxID=1227455 RepID=M0MGP4_9EURY|nr:GNAT family N-acetyltransferase [Halococcus saccharolyticus]EMA43879.1 acetyltransferase [Halococcus saccharolyticus DSM 5350]
MIEYRPIPEAAEERHRAITGYAFDAGSGPYDPDEPIDERRQRRWAFGEDRGVFDGDDLVACGTHIEFTVRLRGEWLPMAGLSGVASPPDRRRQGFVGELLEASLREYRDRDWPIAALWPFKHDFYARYGWATGCRYRTATVDPAALSTVRSAAAGEFRRIEPEEYATLEPVFEAWLDGVNLATRRSDDWWRDRVFQSDDTERYCYVWLREDEPRGYLLYRIRNDDDGRRLVVDEMASADHEAYLNLLRFCHDHDSQVNTVELYGHDHDRLLDVVTDRDAIEVEMAAGQMVRIVDVPTALEAVPYPGVEDATVTVDVDDPHAPWNDATFAIRVEDNVASVERVDAEPDATTDIGTLSQLLVGYCSAEHARVVGDLDVDTSGTADVLDRLFPEHEVFLPEQF